MGGGEGKKKKRQDKDKAETKMHDCNTYHPFPAFSIASPDA